MEDGRWDSVDLPVRYLHSPFNPIAPGGEEPVDPAILGWVNLLRFHGIETCQSCQGGVGHAYPEPTVDFVGDEFEGWYAVSIALRAGAFDGLAPWELRRTWHLSSGQPDQLVWQLVLSPVSARAVADLSETRREILDRTPVEGGPSQNGAAARPGVPAALHSVSETTLLTTTNHSETVR